MAALQKSLSDLPRKPAGKTEQAEEKASNVTPIKETGTGGGKRARRTANG
jgi:hypothetical protein